MTIKEIITKLEYIEGSLDDAFYTLPDYNANSETREYIDTARTEIDYLKYVIEKEKSNLPESNNIKYQDIQIYGCLTQKLK